MHSQHLESISENKYTAGLKYLLMAMLLSLTVLASAQKVGQERIDSLLGRLKDTSNDTNRLKLLSEISYSYCNINPTKGIQYGEELLKLSNSLHEKKYTAYAYLYIGINYLRKSDFPTALDYELKALEIFNQLGDRRSSAKPINNLGIIYFYENDMVKALEYYLKALSIYNEFGMKTQSATVLGNIGQVYQNRQQIDLALEYNLKAQAVFRELNDQVGIARMLGNIGNIYDIKQDYSKALKNKFEALAIWQRTGDVLGVAKVYDNIAYSYLQLATNMNSSSRPDSLPDRKTCMWKAEYYMKMAIEINRNVANLVDLSVNYDGLSNIYLENRDFEKSLEFYRKSVHLRDSVYSVENQRKIKDIERRKAEEINKREMEIKSLQLESAKKERWYYISGLLALLIFILLVYHYFRVQKHVNKLLSTEKKKSDDLLLNILPGEVAEELKQKGASEAKLYNNVTVLFTDFVNFTGISEQMSPTELVYEIHKNFKAFDAIIEKHGLEKIKTIGDAYMAVCGLPNEVPDHGRRVILAALDIQDFILKNEGKFRIRMGVNSGPVVAGIVGIKKFAYDIWGDTVNTANRMESSGEAGKINISGSTYELVKDRFNCTYRGKIQAKHKGDIDMYFVEGIL